MRLELWAWGFLQAKKKEEEEAVAAALVLEGARTRLGEINRWADRMGWDGIVREGWKEGRKGGREEGGRYIGWVGKLGWCTPYVCLPTYVQQLDSLYPFFLDLDRPVGPLSTPYGLRVYFLSFLA